MGGCRVVGLLGWNGEWIGRIERFIVCMYELGVGGVGRILDVFTWVFVLH